MFLLRFCSHSHSTACVIYKIRKERCFHLSVQTLHHLNNQQIDSEIHCIHSHTVHIDFYSKANLFLDLILFCDFIGRKNYLFYCIPNLSVATYPTLPYNMRYLSRASCIVCDVLVYAAHNRHLEICAMFCPSAMPFIRSVAVSLFATATTTAIIPNENHPAKVFNFHSMDHTNTHTTERAYTKLSRKISLLRGQYLNR